MNKHISRGLFFLAFILIAAFVSAQNVDHKVLGIESGVVYSYDVTSSDISNATMIALNMTLTDNIAAGFTFLKGDGTVLPDTISLLALNYGIADRYGLILLLGQGTFGVAAPTALSGIGMYFNIFERKLQDTVSTALKAKVQYLFDPTDDIAGGDLLIGLSVSVGM